MARLRANAEGTVTKCKTPAGIRWQIAIYDDERRKHYSYFRTEREARAALREAQKARDHGRPIKPARHTMRQLFDAWLKSLAAQVERDERSFNTLREYRSYVEQHMKPALGAIDCQRLSVKDVEDYLSRLRLSTKTRANHRIALRRALNVALKWGWVDRNVVTLTDPIPQQPRGVPALSLSDGQKLLPALRDDALWSVYVTALYTGLRAGELAGLAIEHLDVSAGTARICQQVQHVPGQGLVVKGLKTHASNATIDLLPDVVFVLRAAIGERTEGFVWLTKSGNPYDPAYLTHHFQAALTTAGLPVIPLHHLRHYFVSFPPLLDVHPTVARQLARHASMSTTMNIYTSVEEGLKRQALSKLHEALRAVPITADVRTDVQTAGSRRISQAHA